MAYREPRGGAERFGTLRCGNCGIDIEWPPVRVQGTDYCCGGCAAGGPCYCSYDSSDAGKRHGSPKEANGDVPARETSSAHLGRER